MKKHQIKMGALSKMLCTAAVMIAATNITYGQTDKRDTVKVQQLQRVVISSLRADNKTPLTTSTMNRQQLDEERVAVSLPYMMELQPSVVTTSENGMAGQAQMRIRGVDATRINVNINGVTLNDPESHSVYWYNIPNLGGMAQSVQLQRGVGASNGGTAAFGGAMNLQTLNTNSKPYGGADLGLGSFNTRQYGVMAGTGLTKHGLSFDMAYSGLNSDGFRRGGQSEQQSLFLNGGWYGDRSLLKAIVIIGSQHTGITWTGATAEELDADPTYNSRGAYYDSYGNVFYYDNETDNYDQQHYQLYYTYLLNDYWSLSAVADYTHGFGYTESYKDDKKPSSYGLAGLMSGVTRGDFIVNKDMKNDAYTGNLGLQYRKNALTLNTGVNYTHFSGVHYGEVVWADQYADISRDNPFTDWYSMDGTKNDGVIYAKMNYEFSTNFNLYTDLQLRYMDYSMHGTDDDYGQIDYDTNYLFFNPKVGLNYRLDENQRMYVVAGMAHREPARADIKEAYYYGKTMSPEQLIDIELGYQLKRSRLFTNINLYAMLYKNQLVPNGLQTDSGYDLMENVDKSHRLGVELTAGYKITSRLSAEGNVTLSANKINNYQADVIYDDWSDFQTVDFGNTDLAFSPSVTGAALLTYKPVERAKIQLIGKYVGEQYADNTGREESLLDDYFLLNMRLSYTFDLGNSNTLECQVALNNLLDVNYRTNAWCGVSYNPLDGSLSTTRSYFQQPGRNYMVRVIYRF